MHHAVAHGCDQDIRRAFATRLKGSNQTAHANSPSAPDAAREVAAYRKHSRCMSNVPARVYWHVPMFAFRNGNEAVMRSESYPRAANSSICASSPRHTSVPGMPLQHILARPYA